VTSTARQLLLIPNLISLARLALIPVFVWLLWIDEPVAAGFLFAFIGGTDWIDGYLARRLDQVSEVGKALDPVADRLAVVVALVGGLVTGYLPRWFAALLLLREVVMAVAVLYAMGKAGIRLDVLWIGKLATVLVYGAVAGFYVGIGGDIWLIELASWLAGIPGLVLYYYVAGQYLIELRQALRRAS